MCGNVIQYLLLEEWCAFRNASVPLITHTASASTSTQTLQVYSSILTQQTMKGSCWERAHRKGPPQRQ